MKNFVLSALVILFAFACKQKEASPAGSWVAPIEGMEPFQWGFTLNDDGSASSLNSATLQYKSWHQSKDKVILEGESIGNRQTLTVSDTFTLVKEGDRIKSIVSAAGVEYLFADQAAAENVVKEFETEYCFESSSEKQKVFLRYKQAGNVVRGSMIYEVPGKDKNFGSVSGTLLGDTLAGNYDFFAEGTQSFRELVLLKSGNSWKEGTGEIISEGNTAMFKSRSKLDFSKGAVLNQVNCK